MVMRETWSRTSRILRLKDENLDGRGLLSMQTKRQRRQKPDDAFIGKSLRHFLLISHDKAATESRSRAPGEEWLFPAMRKE